MADATNKKPTPEVDNPLVLYHDEKSGTARAAALPPNFSEESEALLFQGTRYTCTGNGIDFWDYLVSPTGGIVGVVLNDGEDFDVSLAHSNLLTASSNITIDDYGYFIYLTSSIDEPEIDTCQAFGSLLFQHDEDYVLFLPDFHRRGYAFTLDSGLITPAP